MHTVSKTFRLKPATAKALEELASARGGVSQTAYLQDLIDREKARLDMTRQEEALDAEWENAMGSAEYRCEMALIEDQFVTADAEAERLIS